MSTSSTPTDQAAITPATAYRPLRNGLTAVGIGYTASWIVGLSVWPSNLSVTSTKAQILAAFSAHQAMATIQYLLTEGLPAFGIAIVSLALGRMMRRTGALRRARVVSTVGVLAAAVSLVQTVLGVILTESAVPAGDLNRAGLLFEAVNRLDGVKMFLLAALALSAHALFRRGALPIWLGRTGLVLAVAITASGVGYLLLNPTMALFAWVSLPLLLVWITGSAVALGRASARTGR